jgi:hypothetical protein
VKSLQQLAADTASPHIGVDKDHGHVAIAGDERSSAVLRATGFSQCHRHHVPVRVEVADDQACLWLSEFLPDPGHAVNAGGVGAWRRFQSYASFASADRCEPPADEERQTQSHRCPHCQHRERPRRC